ncbi:MAG: sulfite exporter TauE/SafE family protein [Hyphomicrobiales bacterium]
MDWLYILMPIAGVKIFWPGLIILGIGVGVIGGFFGMGGAWMVTPGLNILGFPMAFAIGTDIAHMAGKSLISTMRHGKFGNVDYKLGFIMLFGTIAGFELGAQMIMWLERIGVVGPVVRWMYLILLALIAWMVFADVAKKRKKEREAIAAGREVDKLATGIEWHKTLHKIKIPPMVHLQAAGITCSAWLPILVSFFTGWLAGILGIGGGLIRMPSLIYLVGCPTHVAVGTDLFEVMISGLYGAASYTYKGRVELVAAIIMLVGAAMGAQVGSVATKYIKGYGIRIAFGLAVIGCFVSVLLKLIPVYYPPAYQICDVIATVLILGLVCAMSVYITVKMVQGATKEVAMKKAKGLTTEREVRA